MGLFSDLSAEGFRGVTVALVFSVLPSAKMLIMHIDV